MVPDKIGNENALEFSIFCVENLADRLKAAPEAVYHALAEKSDILYGYIVPNYPVLHTQGKEYILEDILEAMQKKGVTV